MPDPTYIVPDNPTYNPEIRALQDSDPAKASTVFNPVLQQMIENTHAVKLAAEENAERISEISEQIPEQGNPDNIIFPDGKNLTDVLDEKADNTPATPSADGLMSSTDKAKLDGIAPNANNYTHPTTAGNKHIPSGGSSGKVLRWASNGTAVWGDDQDTTYSSATTTSNGLMSSSDKKKLDGIAAGANKYTHPATHPASMITGLADVATSGDFADLDNPPIGLQRVGLPPQTQTGHTG